GIVSPSYGVYRNQTKETFNDWYLESLLRSTEYVAEYNRRSTGLHSSRLRLYPDMFFNMEIGFPSKEEQDRIENQVKDQAPIIDATIISTEKEIAVINEYKATLIANAVTGKIKI
ncbi:MAG: restriction endonuclease subunit S, partial [SAR324 cluster bacterium]|nr:restriction endonuclease subunit S [SAR324 cluster bacterium]